MNQYTKGEWKITGKDDNGAVNVFTDKEYIATVRHEYDAWLISAAPDMYKALKQIKKWLLQDGEIDRKELYNQQFVKANDLTAKASAKAEGK